MTMGDYYPRLKTLPGYEALAVQPYPGPGVVRQSFDVSRHDSISLMVLECDYRGPFATECGCTRTRVCLAGKGRPIPGSLARDVTDHDCRTCVGFEPITKEN
jgi:hypothetical protein